MTWGQIIVAWLLCVVWWGDISGHLREIANVAHELKRLNDREEKK